MKIYDPLYGEFMVPANLTPILGTPEFRRLSQIRLLNTISPTLATLGELKRYSHTLGVLFLQQVWEQNQKIIFSKDELDAFRIAIILHDIGTPPFGHLFEYVLRDKFNWNHESVLPDIMRNVHAPENVGHQFFASQTTKVNKLLGKVNVDKKLVSNILTRTHPLSQLLFGQIDLDNIDNVCRMGMSLGISHCHQIAMSAVASIGVSLSGDILCEKKQEKIIKQWMNLRNNVYEILVFDIPTVSAQAVLNKAINIAMTNNILDEADWSLTDEELLDLLRKDKATKNLVNQKYLGVLPNCILAIQIDLSKMRIGMIDREILTEEIEQIAKDRGVDSPLAYIFIDKGTFEKELKFYDPSNNETWGLGKTSSSLIIYIFNLKSRTAKTHGIIEDILSHLSVDESFLVRTISNTEVGQDARQQSFNI